MNQITWQYIAGFFDGEGSITIYSPREKQNYIMISMAQSEGQNKVLYLIQEFLLQKGIAANIYISKPKTQYGRQKLFALCIRKKRESVIFLEGILPYLIVKKDKATESLKIAKIPSKTEHLTFGEKVKILKLKKQGLGCRKIGKILNRPKQTTNYLIQRLKNGKEHPRLQQIYGTMS